MRSDLKGLWLAPILAVGFYALAPAAPFAISILQASTEGQPLVIGVVGPATLAGSVLSVLAAVFCFLPGARRWFFGEKYTPSSDALFRLTRLFLVLGVFIRGKSAFAATPVDGLEWIYHPSVMGVVIVFYVIATIFPAYYAYIHAPATWLPPLEQQVAMLRARISAENDQPIVTYRVGQANEGAEGANALRPGWMERPDGRPVTLRRYADMAPNDTSKGARLPRIIVSLMAAPAAALFALGVYGYFSPGVAPTPDLMAWVSDNQAFLIPGASIYGFLAVALIGWSEAGAGGRSVGGLMLGGVFAGSLWILTPGALLQGAPAAMSFFKAPDTFRTVIFTVADDGDDRLRRGCDGPVIASSPEVSGGAPVALCGLPSGLQGAARPGTRLALEGQQTPFGFSFKTVRPLSD